MIRVVVADDHGARGMVALVGTQDDIEVVGEAADGDEAVAAVGRLLPDVVLTDLRMPGTDGVTATAEIVRRHPEVRVLVVTTYDSDVDIQWRRRGRRHWLSAEGHAVARAARRRRRCGARRDRAGAAGGEPTARPAPRAGARRADAARARGVGVRGARPVERRGGTVKTHLLRSFVKLGVDDRTGAVTAAIERGYLPAPGR